MSEPTTTPTRDDHDPYADARRHGEAYAYHTATRGPAAIRAALANVRLAQTGVTAMRAPGVPILAAYMTAVEQTLVACLAGEVTYRAARSAFCVRLQAIADRAGVHGRRRVRSRVA
jgi:hypothetical protein